MKAKIYRDKGNLWRWTLKADNGRIIADSSEGYNTRQGARTGLETARKAMQSEQLEIVSEDNQHSDQEEGKEDEEE